MACKMMPQAVNRPKISRKSSALFYAPGHSAKVLTFCALPAGEHKTVGIAAGNTLKNGARVLIHRDKIGFAFFRRDAAQANDATLKVQIIPT